MPLLDILFSTELPAATPIDYRWRAETNQQPWEPALLFALDNARAWDETPLAWQDFNLAEATSSGAGQEVLIGGLGSDLLIGVPGQDYLVGGFA